MKLEVSNESMQLERKGLAQVLRAWETSAGFESWSTLPLSTLDF